MADISRREENNENDAFWVLVEEVNSLNRKEWAHYIRGYRTMLRFEYETARIDIHTIAVTLK